MDTTILIELMIAGATMGFAITLAGKISRNLRRARSRALRTVE